MEIRKELTIGSQEARAGLRDLIDAALEQNQHTTVTRNRRPVAVLVPYAWYIEQTAPISVDEANAADRQVQS